MGVGVCVCVRACVRVRACVGVGVCARARTCMCEYACDVRNLAIIAWNNSQIPDILVKYIWAMNYRQDHQIIDSRAWTISICHISLFNRVAINETHHYTKVLSYLSSIVFVCVNDIRGWNFVSFLWIAFPLTRSRVVFIINFMSAGDILKIFSNSAGDQ